MEKTKKFMRLLLAFSMIFSISLFTGCKDDEEEPEPGDNTALIALIAECDALVADAVEGTAPGFYVVGSIATFQTAIDAAQTVADNAEATQETIDAAVANLTAAKTAFEAAVIADVSTEGMVAQWLFNGDATDNTGNGHDGTLMNGPDTWGAGLPVLAEDRFGNTDMCYYFDEGGNIEITYATALNPAQMTWSWWIYMEERANNDYMISMDHWNCYKVNLQTEDKFFGTVKVEDPNTPGEYIWHDRDHAGDGITAETWTHLVVSWGAGHMKFYIDGVMVKDWDDCTDAPVLDISANPVNLIFGLEMPLDTYDSPDWDGCYFKGKMDDFRLYNRVLSDSEVTAIYNIEKP